MLNKHIPDYLVEKNNIITYLVIVFFYSMIFVNVFTPFQGAWYDDNEMTHYQLFMYSLLAVLGGVFLMAGSRSLMAYIHQRFGLTYLQHFVWALFEFILIGLLYTVFCKYGLCDERELSLIFARSMIFIPTILIIPTLFIWMYLNIKERDRIIAELRASSSDKEDKNDIQQSVSNNIINFLDEKGELKLSVRTDSIYYLEAADNYISIYYKQKDDVEHFLLRSSMRKQEELLSERGFVRCHRSFMVNFSKVSLLRKDKNGPYLDFGETGLKEIPISKTYLESVTKHFTFPK